MSFRLTSKRCPLAPRACTRASVPAADALRRPSNHEHFERSRIAIIITAVMQGRAIADPAAERARNLDVFRRFFANDHGEGRIALYATSAVFEQPFARVTLRGRDAIIREQEDTHAKYARWEYFGLQVDPTLDPAAFWTIVQKESVMRDGSFRTRELVNYMRVVDGLVVHRIEYF